MVGAGPRRAGPRGQGPAGADSKRRRILDAARLVFEREGLDGTSLRAIASEAGYTPAALYFHFAAKEEIYAAVLHASLDDLGARVAAEVARMHAPEERLHAAAMAFFGFYADNPRDLDLGFYLLRGGLKPAGLGRAHDEGLNAALAAALDPIRVAALDLGASALAAELLVVDAFAHATGLLLLLHTGRIRMFGASAAGLMEAYIHDRIERLPGR